jgi:hypothetical protein
MEAIHDPVTAGGREWRVAWKKADSVARNEAREAVDSGIAVPRVEYAALAAGLAAREYSQSRFVARAGVVAALIFLVAAVAFLGPGEVLTMVKTAGGFSLIALLWILFFWSKAKKMRRALALNLELLAGAEEDELRGEPPRRTKKEIRREQLVGLVLAIPVFGGWFLVYANVQDRGYLFTFGAALITSPWWVLPRHLFTFSGPERELGETKVSPTRYNRQMTRSSITFNRDRSLLRVALYLFLVLGAVGIELWLQNMAISRCAELGALSECVKKHRSGQDLLKNGAGMAVLALPLLFSAKRMWDKLDSGGAKASFPDDASFQRRLNLVARVGTTSVVVAPIAWLVWLAAVSGPEVVRTFSGLVLAFAVVAIVTATFVMFYWRRKFTPAKP